MGIKGFDKQTDTYTHIHTQLNRQASSRGQHINEYEKKAVIFIKLGHTTHRRITKEREGRDGLAKRK